MKGAAPPRAAFRDVFAVREFRAVWFSEILSVAGDRLALVALTLLVYDRTRVAAAHRPVPTPAGTCRGSSASCSSPSWRTATRAAR